MKRLLLLVTVSMLLAMWILSAWEITQSAAAAPVVSGLAPALANPSIPYPPALWETDEPTGNRPLRPALPPVDLDHGRLDVDRPERSTTIAPILADPIERQRLIR